MHRFETFCWLGMFLFSAGLSGGMLVMGRIGVVAARQGGGEREPVKLRKFVAECVGFSADGKQLYVGGMGGEPLPRWPEFCEETQEECREAPEWQLQVWDWAQQKVLKKLGGSYPKEKNNRFGKANLYALCASPNGKYLLGHICHSPMPSNPYANDYAGCTVWEINKDWRVVASRPFFVKDSSEYQSEGTRVEFLPYDRAGKISILVAIATGTVMSEMRVWEIDESSGKDALSPQIVGSAHCCMDDLMAFALSRDGRRIAMGGHFGVKVRDVLGEKTRKYYRDGHLGPVSCAAFSPDGSLLATGAGEINRSLSDGFSEYFDDDPPDHSVQLRDLKTGKIVSALKFHDSHITQVLFNHDGTRIVTLAAYDGKIRVWETKSAKLLREIKDDAIPPNSRGLRLHPGANVAATVLVHGGVRLWNLDTGEVLATSASTGLTP